MEQTGVGGVPPDEVSARRSRVPWVLLGVLVAMLAATLWLGVQNDSLGQEGIFIIAAVFAIVSYEVVGATVASRAPRNPIGWLLLLVGFTFQVGALTDEVLTYQFNARRMDSFVFETALWFQSWLFAGIAALPLILLLFPDGHPPTRRWRPVVWIAIGVAVGNAIGGMVIPGPLDTGLPLTIQPSNPLGIDALEPLLTPLETILGFGLLAVAALSVVGIVVRWRRSSGVERQQIRILALTVLTAAVTFLATVIVAEVGGDTLEDLSSVLFIATFVFLGIGIPVALGFTILRYRMYDLEVVIRKTVRFAVVAVLILVVVAVTLLVVGSTLAGGTDVLTSGPLVVGAVLGLLSVPLWRFSKRIADRLVFGGRATPYEVLTEFSERMGESYTTDDVLPRMASILGHAVGARRAEVWLGVGDARRLAASWPGDEAPSSPGADVAPVSYHGEELGILSVEMPANDPMDDAKRALMVDLASQAGPVLHNVRLLEDLRESRRRIVSAQDERARKLERDIHDGVQQQLVALAVKLRLADQLIDRDPARAHEALAGLQDDATAALEDLRDLARGIYPPLLADQGLEAALTAQARKAAVPTTVNAAGIGRFPSDVEAAVYFCTLEALNNTAKYAQASGATIEIARVDGHLRFTVSDDGIGFDPSAKSAGTGLRGMGDRLDALGGSIEIVSSPGQGVRIAGSLPAAGGQG